MIIVLEYPGGGGDDILRILRVIGQE